MFTISPHFLTLCKNILNVGGGGIVNQMLMQARLNI